jgi:hypothetical protein
MSPELSKIETYKHFNEAKHGLPESIEIIEVDVGFQRDIAFIRESFQPADQGKRPLSDLLIGFFHFYLTTFDPDAHAISISHGTSLPAKHAYRAFLLAHFSNCPHLSRSLIEPFFDHALFIVEPFDRTVNKGDTVPVKRWPELREKLRTTLESLKAQGRLVNEGK